MENKFDIKTITEILQSKDSENSAEMDERIFSLPLTLGQSASNEVEYDYALKILISLSTWRNAKVRANVVRGFAYLAIARGSLDEYIVVPIIKSEWQSNLEYRDYIQEAITNMNRFLTWHLEPKYWDSH